MSIIIKEKGEIPEDKPKEVRCHKCNSLLEYTSKDVTHDQREGSYIKCPLPRCTAYINV